MKVSIYPDAVRDIDEICWYVGQDNSPAVERFRLALDRSFFLLEGAPYLGRRCLGCHAEVSSVRCWRVARFPNHSIFYSYRPAAGGLMVVRVLHGARNLSSLLEGAL